MANPKKKKGWRKITVNDRKFLWQISTKETDSILKLRADDSSAPSLNIKLVNWRDKWLNFPDPHANEPTIITPAFAAKAILFALANGWETTNNKQPPRIIYNGGDLQI